MGRFRGLALRWNENRAWILGMMTFALGRPKMKRMHGLVSISLFVTGFLVTPAWGSGMARQHDGFFLRLAGGLGYASSDIDDGQDKYEFTGGTGDLEIAIGGMVARNLALHGTLLGWAITDPEIQVNDDSGEFPGDLSLSAVGIGVTYFFMPVNLYLSGTVGFGELTLDVDRLPGADTDTGFVFEGTLGKEWWVSDNWGIGLSGAIGFHSMPDDFVDESWQGANFALRFSATFN
jgi:hypothetical protein